jgi:hypothetical protein
MMNLNQTRSLPLPFEWISFLTYITINNYIKSHLDIQDGDITPSSNYWDVRNFSFFDEDPLMGVTFSFLIGRGGAWGVSSPCIGIALTGPSPEFIGFTLIAVFWLLPTWDSVGWRDSRDSALDFSE